jgi:carbamoyl-phosphate synthase large subunit
MSLNIAISGVGGVIGYGIIKSIHSSTKFGASRIIGIDCNPDAVGLYLCDKHYIAGLVSSPGYIDSLLDICHKEAIDLLIPVVEDELLPIHDNMRRFEEIGTKVMIQPRKVVEIFGDKYLSSVNLRNSGIAAPETVLFKPENTDMIMDLKEKYGFPLIIKPRYGRGSRGLFIIKTVKQLDAYMDILINEQYVIQEYLGNDDQEYTCAVFKTPTMKEPYMIILKRQLNNGTTVSAEVTFDDTLTKICKDIINMTPIEGSLNIQARKKNNTPYAFDINTRYSSTTYIRTMCGFNDVHMGIEYFLNNRIDDAPKIKKEKIVRYWEELRIVAS